MKRRRREILFPAEKRQTSSWRAHLLPVVAPAFARTIRPAAAGYLASRKFLASLETPAQLVPQSFLKIFRTGKNRVHFLPFLGGDLIRIRSACSYRFITESVIDSCVDFGAAAFEFSDDSG